MTHLRYCFFKKWSTKWATDCVCVCVLVTVSNYKRKILQTETNLIDIDRMRFDWQIRLTSNGIFWMRSPETLTSETLHYSSVMTIKYANKPDNSCVWNISMNLVADIFVAVTIFLHVAYFTLSLYLYSLGLVFKPKHILTLIFCHPHCFCMSSH